MCKDEREPLNVLKDDESVVEDEELANESKERNEFVELVLDDNPDCGGENSKLVALGAKKFESEELDRYLHCFLISSGTVPRPALPLNDRVTPWADRGDNIGLGNCWFCPWIALCAGPWTCFLALPGAITGWNMC